jgi:hypothetical protein
MNLHKLTDIVIGGINMADYPDFCDAYIESACHPDGEALTDDELEVIDEDDETAFFVNEQIHENKLYL